MRHFVLSLSLLAFLPPGTARADFDPATGRVVLDEAGVSVGMEGPGAFGDLVPRFLGPYRDARAVEADARLEAGQAIEGDQALLFGGDLAWMVIDLTAVAGELAGRRVEISLWVRPEGTSIQGGASWTLGSLWEHLRGVAPAHPLGDVRLRFTGERTSDGWERWSTGPFDFSLGGTLPLDALWVYDRQVGPTGTYVEQNAHVHARLDALQIRDLGPAAVSPEACSLATEAAVCGDAGACLFGRCVDAAAVVGAAIGDPALRREFLARRAFEFRTFDGSRVSRERMDGFEAALTALAGDDRARPFWAGLSGAVAGLADGHARPPSEWSAQAFSAGVCLGPGVADLVDGAPAPLVFRTQPQHPIGGLVLRGDVLVAVDGESVETFRERAARHLYYAGDPAAEEAAITGDLMAAALLAGSTLTFRRCPALQADATCAGPLETFEVDLAAAAAGLWDPTAGGSPVSWPEELECDGRFRLPQGPPQSAEAGWAKAYRWDGVQYLMFNGFPSPWAAPDWEETLFTPLRAVPDRIVIDERKGYGGLAEVLYDLVGHFIEGPEVPLVDLFPAADWPLDLDGVESLRACLATSTEEMTCGWVQEWRFGEGHPAQGLVKDSRVALLVSDDVSANDFFTRLMRARPGETRVFGPGPTRGAFGAIQALPSLLGEASGGTFQVHDTLFVSNPVGPLPPWSTGTGVAPDVVVRQTQSDLMLGVDTLLQAATLWVKQ